MALRYRSLFGSLLQLHYVSSALSHRMNKFEKVSRQGLELSRKTFL